MRRIILAIVFITSLSAFAQQGQWDAPLPETATTVKEYNYLTKGLKIQLESGLDVIDGYSLLRGENKKLGNYNFNAQYLYKKSENKIKAMSIIITSNVSGKTYYLCVPYQNKQLLVEYWNSINVFDETMSRTFVYFMSNLYIENKIFSTNALLNK